MSDTLPFSFPFDLSTVSPAGHEEVVEVPQAACRLIAEAYGVDAIEDFTARFRLTRLSKNEYALAGRFAATIFQTCVVTLKPVRTAVAQEFERRYDIAPANMPGPVATSVNVELESEDREILRGTSLDLAVPLLEELSLAIDRYPRAPGAAFESGFGQASPEESPFAVLKTLKDKLAPPEKT